MPYWKDSEPGIEYRERPVYPNNRMTEYEARRFKFKVDKLLETLDKPLRDKHSINGFVAYGKHSLIGAFMEVGNDPLGNGIIVGNFEEFDTNAVNSSSSPGEVFIRFEFTGEIDL